MRRLQFNVAYDGTDFHGWQAQPDLLTVQGVLESVIGSIEGGTVHVDGSGRTDAGVHALAQVAAVTLNNPIPVDNFRRAVNRLLPLTIRISNVEETAGDFHPAFTPGEKHTSTGFFAGRSARHSSGDGSTTTRIRSRKTAMISAAALYAGGHDFTAFAAADEKDALGRWKWRFIYHSTLRREDQSLIFGIAGSGFLKHMVRNLVGVLLEVGKGNLDADAVCARLANGPQYRPGPTAPGKSGSGSDFCRIRVEGKQRAAYARVLSGA